MRKPPGLIIVVDPSKEDIAVAEAKKLGIPVMALSIRTATQIRSTTSSHATMSSKEHQAILQSLTETIIERKNELNFGNNKRRGREEDC